MKLGLVRQMILMASVAALVVACRKQPKVPPMNDAGPFLPVKNPLAACPDPAQCELSCRQNKADDCVRLGNNYTLAQGVPKDDTRAAALFEQACTLGNAAGCTFAGRMYEFAHGVAKDDTKAASLYERACKLDYLTGCYNFAIMLDNGRGIARDQRRAYELYSKVCAQGGLVACERADQLKPASEQSDGGR